MTSGTSVILDEAIDVHLDKMIEKDIMDLEDTFYNCFHAELHEQAHHGGNSNSTLQEKCIGHLKTRVSKAEEVIERYRVENQQLRSTLKSSAVKIEHESKHIFVNTFNDMLKEAAEKQSATDSLR